MIDAIAIIIGAAILIIYLTDRFLLKKQISDVTMEKEVREAILSLFVFAEKQGWTGESKMAYVAHKIHDIIPGATLQAVIKEEQLTIYLQNMYDAFKHKLYK